MTLSTTGRFGAALLLTASALSACGDTTGDAGAAVSTTQSRVATSERTPSAFHGTLVDPAMRRPELRLRDIERQTFSLAERPGDEVTVLFFGYTHCPDVCPTTMADLAAAYGALPPEVSDRVTIAFVTEDPTRDTPAAMRRWLDQFDPSFVGLVGGNAATRSALAELHLPQSRRIRNPDQEVEHPDTGEDHHDHGDYIVEHAGIVYAFGPGGATVIYTGGTSPREYAEDFVRLAEEN